MGRIAVKMRADHEIKGKITPLKFKYQNEQQEDITIPVGRVKNRTENRFAGNRMLVFQCESTFDNQIKTYELRYELDTCIWYYYY